MSKLLRPSARRGGFTLVELLVVITIIGLLAAIVIPAVMGYINYGYVMTTSNDLSQMDQAIEAFKQTYKVKYIPSRLVLCEFFGDYNTNFQVDQDSIVFLQQVWPNLLSPDPLNPNAKPKWDNVKLGGIDWNGNGKLDRGRMELFGDQVIVFCLGGIPISNTGNGFGIPSNANGGFGFATNPRDPASVTQTTGRKGPFFTFQSARLVQLKSNPQMAIAADLPKVFFSYLNPYPAPFQAPYAYFSSYGVANQYSPYDANGKPATSLPGKTDCPFVNVNPLTQALLPAAQQPMPYMESTTPTLRYYNRDSHQIISAGADGIFGPGGVWPPNGGPGNTPTHGKDDQANFNGGNLMTSSGN